MQMFNHTSEILVPLITAGISWVSTRWYERKRYKAETATVEVGNTRSEIENYKMISIEWREAAQQWKGLVDEYQQKLIENAKRIDELYEQNREISRALATVKGQLTKAQSRIKELEKQNDKIIE